MVWLFNLEKLLMRESASLGHGETSKVVPLSCPPSYRVQDVGLNREPQHFENELCEGKVLVMMRPTNLNAGETWRYREWFKGKARRMEIQVQVRLKENASPRSVWVCISPTPLEKVSLNLATTAFCKIILACISHFLGVAFKWSFGGNGEIPHMSLPADSMLSMLVTSPGQTPPCLGTDDMRVVPAKASQIREEWAKAMPFDSNHTYTLTFYSKYLDIARWSIVDIPGIGHIGLETFGPGASSLDIIIQREEADAPRTYMHLQLGRFNARLLHSRQSDFIHSNKIADPIADSSSENARPHEKQRSCCVVDLLGCLCFKDVESKPLEEVVRSLPKHDVDTQCGKVSSEKAVPAPLLRWSHVLCAISFILVLFAVGCNNENATLSAFPKL
jgi:hypothetical protein